MTTQPTWLDGTYEEAMQMVAERLLYARTKQADFSDILQQGKDLLQQGVEGGKHLLHKGKDLLENDDVRRGLIGCFGVGGSLGLASGAMGEGGHKFRNTALGMLLGTGIGVGGGRLYAKAKQHQAAPKPPAKHTPQEKATAAVKAQSGHQGLGILGADEKKVNEAVGDLRSGKSSPDKARSQLHKAVPSASTQLHNWPGAMGTAVSQGRLGDFGNQADIFGLKSVNPLSSHFSPTTVGLSAGAYGATRGIQELMDPAFQREALTRPWMRRLSSKIPAPWMGQVPPKPLPAGVHGPVQAKVPATLENWLTRESEIRNSRHALAEREGAATKKDPAGDKSKGGKWPKIPGGAAATVAALSPLLMREWLSRGGYRSGGQPINDLVEANKVLGA